MNNNKQGFINQQLKLEEGYQPSDNRGYQPPYNNGYKPAGGATNTLPNKGSNVQPAPKKQ